MFQELEFFLENLCINLKIFQGGKAYDCYVYIHTYIHYIYIIYIYIIYIYIYLYIYITIICFTTLETF